MKKQSFASIWWVIKLQYQTAPAAFVWNFFYNIYNGLIGIFNTFVAAKLLTSVTEVAFASGTSRSVYIWLFVLLVSEIVSSVLQSLSALVNKRIDQKLQLAVSERYYNKLYELNQQQFEDEAFNTTATRAQDSLYQLWRLTSELTSTVSSLISFIVAMIAILVVAPPVGALIIIVVIPVALIGARQNKASERAYKQTQPIDRVAWRTRWYLIDPQHMPEVRLINGFKHLVRTWQTNVAKSNDILFAVERKNAVLEIASNILNPIATFLANVYFFRLLAAGTIGLDRFIFLRGIVEQAAASALSLARSAESLHKISIDFGNFNEFYYTKPAILNGTRKVTGPLTVEFRNVSFTYPSADKPSLSNISFVITPGSRLALVGENGAGKTTLIKLLLRQYMPTKGQILVNGIDIQDIEQDSYYRALSILSQDFLILSHLTIAENLSMGLHRNISDTEIYKVLDMVGAKDFVQKLPHKLDQRLDSSFDDGSNLSGGQTQRLGVARALLRNGDIMILDEPTSAIDAKAEYTIFNNIYKAHAEKTTLIVSHRFSTVRKADKVIVMDTGRIIEYGSHEELMTYGGLYKEMFEIQAEGYR